MPSIIQADQLKSADGATTYLNSGTLSNVTFPAGMSYYLSTMTEMSVDSGDQNLNTTYGFGTVTGPISLPNNTRIRMHAFGGMVEYDAIDEWGSSVNWKTGSTFTSSTDGSFTNAVNWTNSPQYKLTSNYINADYSNTSGSSVNIYFRPGMKSSGSVTNARWFATFGSGYIRTWYELIQI